jgi:hypothetical protein
VNLRCANQLGGWPASGSAAVPLALLKLSLYGNFATLQLGDFTVLPPQLRVAAAPFGYYTCWLRLAGCTS